PALELVVVVGADVALPFWAFEELAVPPAQPVPAPPTNLDAAAWMVYTSGTTGRPKGVMLSQRGCLWVVASCWAPVVGLSADDYLLSPLPLFHSYAVVLSILAIVAVGARARILARFSTS